MERFQIFIGKAYSSTLCLKKMKREIRLNSKYLFELATLEINATWRIMKKSFMENFILCAVCLLPTALMTDSQHCVKSVQIRSFFWSLFSRIRTEYGKTRSISPYSVIMLENTDQKKHRIWTLFKQCSTQVQIRSCET